MSDLDAIALSPVAGLGNPATNRRRGPMKKHQDEAPPLATAIKTQARPTPQPLTTKEEMLRFLDLVDEMENETEHALPCRSVDPFYRMTIFLVRQHLEAKLVTITSLAAASAVPYATAMRRIEQMIDQGLILRRPRTRTGRTFSLHPSEQLIDSWYGYARRLRRVIAKAGNGSDERALTHDYYFGRSWARILPPPSALAEPLNLVPPLRILVHADPTLMSMEALTRQFEHLLGTRIRFRPFSIDRLRQEGLANRDFERSRYDLIAANLPWVGEFAEQSGLRPLDDLVDSADLQVPDFHQAGWNACRWKGRQYGIPIQITSELLFYREDIFDEHGIAPPETTDDVLAAARKLHRPHVGLRGIAWNAARGTPMGHTFVQVLAAFGRPVINLCPCDDGFDPRLIEGEQFRPMIDSPEGLGTAEYLRELIDYAPLNILSMAWYERVVAYSRGEVAMSYGWSQRAPYFELDETSPAHRTTGFLPHPRGPCGRNIAPVGGYLLGIPANLDPKRLDAVWRALKLLTSPEAIKLYALNGSLVTSRFSVSADPEVRAQSSIIGAVDMMARAGQLQFWPRPPVPEMADVITICGEEMHDMCRGVKSPAEAITQAQNRADRLMRSHGHY